MRLILLALALVFTFVNGVKNRSPLYSFKQSFLWGLPLDEDSGYIRRVRSVTRATPEMTTALQQSAQVLRSLGDVPIQQFAERILKMEPKKLIATLKAFSIAASLVTEVPNEATDKLINAMHFGFGKIEEKINRQTEIKPYIDQFSIYSEINISLNVATTAMKQYFKRSHPKSRFLSVHRDAKVSTAISYLILQARDMQNSVMEGSRYKPKSLKLSQSLIMKCLLQAYTVEYFRAGLVFKDSELQTELRNLNKAFNEEKNNLWKLFKEMTALLRKSFFPGFIREDFIRTSVDCVLGNNCNMDLGNQDENGKIANHIVKSLNRTYPWRGYICFVSDAAMPGRDFIFHPVAGGAMLDHHNGKTILLFLASENYQEVYKRYDVKSIQNKMNSVHTNGFDMNPFLEYARNSEDELQMAVYSEKFPGWQAERNVSHFMGVIVKRFDRRWREHMIYVTVIF